MTIAAPPASQAELLPGYYLGAAGSWRTLPQNFDENDTALTALAWGVVDWCEMYLVHHLTGEPWRFTSGQLRFLLRWYAVDAAGRFLYRRGVKRGAKGTGKDPLAAVMSMAELAGPVRYSHHEDGRPVGVKHRMALVQIASNSEKQSAKVLRVANSMASLALRELEGLDVGQTRTQTASGSRIEILTSSEASMEGDPATAVMLNETHHMTQSNGGLKVAAVAQRNVGKSPSDLQARLCEFTNAHREGSDSRAERSYHAWQDQLSGRRGGKVDILYDSIEAPTTIDMSNPASLRAGIVAAYSDAPWADIDRLCDEANDPDTSLADLIRYYLNGLGAAEDAWIQPGNFDALGRPDTLVDRLDQVAVFLDCSKSGDATGVVACRLSDSYVFTVGVWQKPHGWNDKLRGPWRVNRAEVDAKIRTVFAEYSVAWFGVDPSPAKDDENDDTSYWMPLIDDWHRDFKDTVAVWATPGARGHSVLFDMRLSKPGAYERMRLFTDQAMQTVEDIDGPDDETDFERVNRLADPAFMHDGDPILRMHTHNARRRPNQWGTSLGKQTRDSANLVDLAVCMVGALMGRRIALNSGALARKRTGKVW